MALERSADLEQTYHEWRDAFKRRDFDAMRELISTHPATVSRGSAPEEVGHGRDEIMAAIQSETSASIDLKHVEAYADGDLGYLYSEVVLTYNGVDTPMRGLIVAHREDGRWRLVNALQSVPVPNEMLTHDSALTVSTAGSAG